jgi:hypothetical protein
MFGAPALVMENPPERRPLIFAAGESPLLDLEHE